MCDDIYTLLMTFGKTIGMLSRISGLKKKQILVELGQSIIYLNSNSIYQP